MTRNPILRDVVALAALVLIGVGIPLVLVVKAQGVGLPHNDDWVYMLGATNLYRSGAISMPGHSAAAVGQLILAQPLLHLANGNPWAFTAFGLGMTALGIAATYLLARAFLGLAGAVLVALLVIAFPGFERQAATFMTDGPAFALEMLSLLLGVVWLRSGRWAAFAGSMVIALIGVAIREFAVIVPGAVLGISLVRPPTGTRRGVVVAGVLTALGIVAVLLASRTPPPAGASVGFKPDAARILWLSATLTTFAAVLLPAILLAVGRHLRVLNPIQFVVSLAVVMIALAVAGVGPLIGNTWTATGTLGRQVLSGIRPLVGNAIFWSMSENLAVLAAVLGLALVLAWAYAVFGGTRTIGTLWRRGLEAAQTPTAVLALFILGYGAALAVANWRMPVFDRDLYPMVPAGAIILVRAAGPVRWLGRAQVATYAALGWLAVSAAMMATNSFGYDAARWRAGEAAVAAGYPASTVDAGYEWVGFHASPRPANAPGLPGLTGYDNALLSAMPCALVSNSALALPHYTLIHTDTAAYREFLVIGPRERLYLYGLTDPRCPPPAGR